MYEKQTIQPKILEILGTEIPGKKFSRMLVYLTKLSSFPKISENAVPFAIGNVWKYVVEWKSAPQFHLARLEIITDWSVISCCGLKNCILYWVLFYWVKNFLLIILINRWILQVLQQLPAKHDHVIKVVLTDDQRQLYNDSVIKCSKQFKQSGKIGDTLSYKNILIFLPIFIGNRSVREKIRN